MFHRLELISGLVMYPVQCSSSNQSINQWFV